MLSNPTISVARPAHSRILHTCRCVRLCSALVLALAAPLAWAGAEPSGATHDRQPDIQDAQHLDKIVVTASVDPLTTEGTGAYSTGGETTATRLPLTLRETPASVSVVTRAKMNDFGLDDANAVLANTTGVNVERIETNRTYYSARGFDVTNFLVDGLGMPFTHGAQWGNLDMVVYDHVEVLRGANGLLSFTGNPSATINFVRKRPTEYFQGIAALTLGSWDTRRLMLDLSGPLSESGNVRGRVIALDQNGDSYLDRYSLHKQVFSGIVEVDLDEATLLSAGFTYQKNRPEGSMWGALPLFYTDGTPTDFDRSTSTATDWAYWNSNDARAFVGLDHRLGNDWTLKLSLNHRRFGNTSDLFFMTGTPDADTGLGLTSYPSHYTGLVRQDVADVSVSGPFTLGGRKHQLVAGLDVARNRNQGLSLYGNDIGTPLPPLDEWRGDYPKPAFDASSDDARFNIHRQSAYLTVRWSLADPLTLITGASLTRMRGRGDSYGVPYRYDATHTTPFAGLVYDFGKHLSAYASYAKIFNPQTQVDVNNHVLDPINGSSLEAGIKGAWYGGQLNAALSVFRVRQNHFAEQAGFNASTGQFYYRGSNATSKGYELDVAGRLGDRWQISAGYTHMQIDDETGAAARTYVPRQNFNLAASWRVPGVDGLKLGATWRWQSVIWRDQGVLDTQGHEIVTRQGAYGLLGLMASYAFTPSWKATFNIDNVTDEKYINSLYWDQGFYGAPRHYRLDIRWTF